MDGIRIGIVVMGAWASAAVLVGIIVGAGFAAAGSPGAVRAGTFVAHTSTTPGGEMQQRGTGRRARRVRGSFGVRR